MWNSCCDLEVTILKYLKKKNTDFTHSFEAIFFSQEDLSFKDLKVLITKRPLVGKIGSLEVIDVLYGYGCIM